MLCRINSEMLVVAISAMDIPISRLCPLSVKFVKWPIQTKIIKKIEKKIKKRNNFHSLSPCERSAIVNANPSGR